ncbi:MAG TPA: HigA family addiction module antitoxin [Candidatus Hydrogenedentes bacterium]|nr:HigA family addiction module antitoxin [Candidatus Hydrogenedentota bacterium]
MERHLVPSRVPAPGRILEKELQARGWTQKELALRVKRPVQAINEIIKGKKSITPETALDLSDTLGISPEFWLNLEMAYRLHVARHKRAATHRIIMG